MEAIIAVAAILSLAGSILFATVPDDPVGECGICSGPAVGPVCGNCR